MADLHVSLGVDDQDPARVASVPLTGQVERVTLVIEIDPAFGNLPALLAAEYLERGDDG